MAVTDWNWQDMAACRGADLVLFFGPDGERQPERDVRERKAKAICAQCPSREACLDYALSRPEKYGTWGGLNEDERASERRRRMRRAAMAGVLAAADSVMEKYCIRCGMDLSVTEFSRDVTKKDGLHAWCRGCVNEACRERRSGQEVA